MCVWGAELALLSLAIINERSENLRLVLRAVRRDERSPGRLVIGRRAISQSLAVEAGGRAPPGSRGHALRSRPTRAAGQEALGHSAVSRAPGCLRDPCRTLTLCLRLRDFAASSVRFYGGEINFTQFTFSGATVVTPRANNSRNGSIISRSPFEIVSR